MDAADSDRTYDSIARWYDDWVGSDEAVASDPYAGPLLQLIGDVAGLRLCDLACGQGRLSRHLAGQGAVVVGVDNSLQLLAIAAGPERVRAAVEYRYDNAHTLVHCADGEFDSVVCNMSLMDIPDLAAAVTSVYRVVRLGGWFAFSTFHPCFNAPRSAQVLDDDGRPHRTVTDYFSEGFWRSDERAGPPGTVGAYHRTLATLLNTVIGAGFRIGRVQEIAGPSPGWQQVPPVLAAVAHKPVS